MAPLARSCSHTGRPARAPAMLALALSCCAFSIRPALAMDEGPRKVLLLGTWLKGQEKFKGTSLEQWDQTDDEKRRQILGSYASDLKKVLEVLENDSTEVTEETKCLRRALAYALRNVSLSEKEETPKRADLDDALRDLATCRWPESTLEKLTFKPTLLLLAATEDGDAILERAPKAISALARATPNKSPPPNHAWWWLNYTGKDPRDDFGSLAKVVRSHPNGIPWSVSFQPGKAIAGPISKKSGGDLISIQLARLTNLSTGELEQEHPFVAITYASKSQGTSIPHFVQFVSRSVERAKATKQGEKPGKPIDYAAEYFAKHEKPLLALGYPFSTSERQVIVLDGPGYYEDGGTSNRTPTSLSLFDYPTNPTVGVQLDVPEDTASVRFTISFTTFVVLESTEEKTLGALTVPYRIDWTLEQVQEVGKKAGPQTLQNVSIKRVTEVPSEFQSDERLKQDEKMNEKFWKAWKAATAPTKRDGCCIN